MLRCKKWTAMPEQAPAHHHVMHGGPFQRPLLHCCLSREGRKGFGILVCPVAQHRPVTLAPCSFVSSVLRFGAGVHRRLRCQQSHHFSKEEALF